MLAIPREIVWRSGGAYGVLDTTSSYRRRFLNLHQLQEGKTIALLYNTYGLKDLRGVESPRCYMATTEWTIGEAVVIVLYGGR